jgi:hypothetical protein
VHQTTGGPEMKTRSFQAPVPATLS